MMSLSHKDQVLWPVYITIGNINAKMCRSQNWPGTLFLNSISIVDNQTKDSNNKNRDLKAKIYHLAFETMLKRL